MTVISGMTGYNSVLYIYIAFVWMHVNPFFIYIYACMSFHRCVLISGSWGCHAC